MRLHISDLNPLRIQADPEAIFLQGWLLCDIGAHETGLPYLQQAIASGYSPAPTLARSPQFDALRSGPAFETLVAEADAGRQRAAAAFRSAGGDRFLGTQPVRTA